MGWSRTEEAERRCAGEDVQGSVFCPDETAEWEEDVASLLARLVWLIVSVVVLAVLAARFG